MPPNVPYKKQAGVVTSLVRVREQDIETEFLTRLDGLKYILRPDIRDRDTLEQNFHEKFESLNRVRLTDAEFARLLDEIVTADVFTAAKTLRQINAFTRDNGTPLNYTLVYYRRGHAAHRVRFQIPQHALRGQEPQASRIDSGVLTDQSCSERHQALRQYP